MRIRELLETKNFDEMQYVKKGEEEAGINYDLTEDLVFFMNNDDSVYRRFVYPSIATCIDRMESKKDTTPSLFTNAVKESYKTYIKKYPIRHLPDEIEEKFCEEVCKKMHEDLRQHYDDGKFKE
jgi:hypothetical protein